MPQKTTPKKATKPRPLHGLELSCACRFLTERTTR